MCLILEFWYRDDVALSVIRVCLLGTGIKADNFHVDFMWDMRRYFVVVCYPYDHTLIIFSIPYRGDRLNTALMLAD